MLAILVVALLVRLVLSTQTIIYPADEMWQYIEPAWGRITGFWIETWEFHAGIRGWLIPMMLIPPLWLGHALAPASMLHLTLLRVMLSLASLGVVVSFYDMGARISRRHAVVAGWVAAIWVEIFYFGPRASSEAIAVSLLVPAIALLTRLDAVDGRKEPLSPRRHALQAGAAGLLLALGLIARFQYAPAIAFAALWGPGRDQRRTLPPLILGAAVGLGLGALADLAANQTPYAWILANLTINVGEGVSNIFGTEPPWWFLTTMLATWGWGSLLLLPCIAAGARSFPMPMAVAVVIIANHSAMAHKEYRFVLLAVVLLIFLAAVGSVGLAGWLARRARVDPRRIVLALCLMWPVLSLSVGLTEPFKRYWGAYHDLLGVLIKAGERPDLCGLAFYHPPGRPTAAYSGLNRAVPMLLFDNPQARAALFANQQRFNTVIAPWRAAGDLPGGYKLSQCLASGHQPPSQSQYCLFTRLSGCSGGGGVFDYNRVLYGG